MAYTPWPIRVAETPLSGNRAYAPCSNTEPIIVSTCLANISVQDKDYKIQQTKQSYGNPCNVKLENGLFYKNRNRAVGYQNDLDLLHQSFSCLKEENLPNPSTDDLVKIICLIRKYKRVEYAHDLYDYMRSKDLDTHLVLGNYLVPLLIEVGNVDDAYETFLKLRCRNEFSYTSLITGYVKCGKPNVALDVYQRMLKDISVRPNGYTFVAVLKACTELKNLKTGREIHAKVAKMRLLDRDVFLANTLIDMYAKNGALNEARGVFKNLKCRDVVSWNALITGCVEHGQSEEALMYFRQMQCQRIPPNPVTFICCLKACTSNGDISLGYKMHADIVKMGFLEGELPLACALIDIYSKCGLIEEAQKVFDEFSMQHVILWTALMSGYIENGYGEEALICFHRMWNEGISPDPVTFIRTLKACGIIGSTSKGDEIHAEIARRRLLEKDVIIGNALIDMYVKCGSLVKAREVFDRLPFRDVVSWTTLIGGYTEMGHGVLALNLFEEMQIQGIDPNAVTYICILKACSTTFMMSKAQEIHREIERKGLLKTDMKIGHALLDMYARSGFLEKAQEVFEKLPSKDLFSWTVLISAHAEHGNNEKAFICYEEMEMHDISSDAVTAVCVLKACTNARDMKKGKRIHTDIVCKGFLESDLTVGIALVDMYGKCGSLSEAEDVFNKLPVHEIFAWNALITSYIDHKYVEKVFQCFEYMKTQGIIPDAVTYLCVVKACGMCGALHQGEQIHYQIEKQGMLQNDIVIGNALLDMYIKFGLIEKAEEVFDSLPIQDVVSYTAVMTGYSQNGEYNLVFAMLDRMVLNGNKPNSVTFVSVLTACCHAGLIDIGEMYFETMAEVYDILPVPEHLTCMADLLCRAGQLEKALAMVKAMVYLADLSVWHTVLAACQKSGHIELAREAFEQAVGLDGMDVVAYISMSNIYADADIDAEYGNM